MECKNVKKSLTFSIIYIQTQKQKSDESEYSFAELRQQMHFRDFMKCLSSYTVKL